MRKTEQLERLLAWARYLFWADLERKQFDSYVENQPQKTEWQDWEYRFALVSKWYAAEYVVIEGWQAAHLQDPIIDRSLVRWSDVVDSLRRYRNGVFHYQPKLLDSRFTVFLKDSEQTMFWAHYLHSEFLRFYWSYVNDCPGTKEQRAEFLKTVLDIVGWIPDDSVEARTKEIRELAAEAERMTGGRTEDHAVELRQAAEDARLVADDVLARHREQCRVFLARTK